MIEILSYTPVSNPDKKTIGYIDIELKKLGLIIRRIAHVQSGEKRWFALPSFFEGVVQGKNKYRSYISFKQEAHNGELLNILKPLVEKFCVDEGITMPKTLTESIPDFDDSQCPF